MTSYYTLEHKTVICPKWHEEITVTAKYRYIGNSADAVYVASECAILHNISLPRSKRNPKLSLFAYCDCQDTCPCLKDFPKYLKH